MVNWKDRVRNFVGDVENRLDTFRSRVQRPFDESSIVITPYLGYVADGMAYLRGRVLRDTGLSQGRPDDKIWDNLLNMYRRFETDEVAFAVVRAEMDAHSVEVTCDDEGYFEVMLPCERPAQLTKAMWNMHLEVVNVPNLPEASFPDTRVLGTVIVEPLRPQFGIISDLDDTVMRTDVTRLLEMARNTLLRNAHTRLPFDGVAAFYTALQEGVELTQERGFNPLFYVSSSPWNLYDLITDFFEVRGIPLAPVFLRDVGLSKTGWLGASHELHKIEQIKRILDHFPDLPFILVGDSGQHDPEIYRQIVLDHPNRVLAIYIRNVTKGAPRRAIIKRLSSELQDHAVDMLLVTDTYEAARHAVQRNFIESDALDDIYVEAQQDKNPPTPLESAVAEDR